VQVRVVQLAVTDSQLLGHQSICAQRWKIKFVILAKRYLNALIRGCLDRTLILTGEGKLGNRFYCSSLITTVQICRVLYYGCQ